MPQLDLAPIGNCAVASLVAPQTYPQVGIILTAHRLDRTWEQGLWHVS